MTLGDIATKARNLVNANATSYSDADLLIDLNLWWQKVGAMIHESQDGMSVDDTANTTYPEATRELIASQRDYSFGDATWDEIGVDGGSAGSDTAIDVNEVKRVDVTYDGTNWYRAYPFDISVINEGIGNDTTLDGSFSKTQPAYDFRSNALFIYPLANAADVTAGAKVRVIYTRPFVDFTSGELSTGTLVPGFFKKFHPILSYGPAFEHAVRHGLENKEDLLTIAVDYENRIKRSYSNAEKDANLRFGAAFTDYE